MDSSSRYYLSHTFLRVIHATELKVREKTASEYKQAFAEGRLKKRRLRESTAVKVWTEPKV